MSEETTTHPSSEAPEESPRPRRSKLRRAFRLLLFLLFLAGLLGVGGWLYLRSARFNRTAVKFIETKLRDYGLRGEIGGFGFTLSPQTARLKDFKIFNEQNGLLIATIEELDVEAEVREPFALRKSREIALKDVRLKGLEFHFEFDRQGHSNFEGLRKPPTPSKTIVMDYSRLAIVLEESRIRFLDRRVDFEIGLDQVALTARSEDAKGSSFAIEMAAPAGHFGFEGRTSPIGAVDLRGQAGGSGMKIDRLKLQSKLTELTASGKMLSWAPLKYEVEFASLARLEEVTKLFAPTSELAGLANCQCRIEGEGPRFEIAGAASARQMSIAGAQLTGVEAPGASFRRAGDHFEFSSRFARAGAVRIDEIVLTDARINSPRGQIKGRRTTVTAPGAVVGGVEWPRSKLGKLDLAAVKAEFVGRTYRVEAQSSLTEGTIAGIDFRQATANALFDNDALVLNGIQAQVYEGSAAADLTLPLKRGVPSTVKGSFVDVPTRELFSLFEIENLPVAGQVTGEAEISWIGSDAETINGNVTARFKGGTPRAAVDIPVSGDLKIAARDGVFDFTQFDLLTEGTNARARGTLAVSGESDLRIDLKSTRATELVAIARSIDELRPLIDEYLPYFPGKFNFDGRLGGNLREPVLEGKAEADPFGLRQTEVGAIAGRLYLSGQEVRLGDGTITAIDGGKTSVALAIPFDPRASSGTLDASIGRLDLERVLTAIGIDEANQNVEGQFAGEIHLTGLPGKINGPARLRLIEGTIVRQPVQLAQAEINFVDHLARLESLIVRLPQTMLQAGGSYNLADDAFNLKGQANQISLASLAEALEINQFAIEGDAETRFEMIGKLSGEDAPTLDWRNFTLSLVAGASKMRINKRPVGDYRIHASTTGEGILRAVLNSEPGTTARAGRELLVATVALKDKTLPLTLRGDLERLELAPLLAILAPEQTERVSGAISGHVEISGPIRDEEGKATADRLRGNLTVAELDLVMAENRIRLASPVNVQLERSQVTVPTARLIGQGLELTFTGEIGLAEHAPLNFSLNGNIALDQFPVWDETTTAFGNLVILAQARGTVKEPNLTGAVDIRGLGLSSRDWPFFLTNGNGLVTLAGNQLVVNNFRAAANDGRLEARGTVKLDGFQPSEWNFEFKADKAEIYFREINASLSAQLALTGNPRGQTLSGSIATTQLEYDSSIDLDNLIGGGSARLDFDFGTMGLGGPGPGSSSLPPTKFDLRLEARDSLVIRGEQVNALGTALLTLSGTSKDPSLTGRIESESGFVRFRGQRYEITRATLDLPPGNAEAVLNLVAESEFSGYRVSLGLAGQVDSIETTLRSEPPLSRDEIIALITTGRTEAGTLTSQDPLRSGVGAAASLLSSGFISKPTEQLLGLSRFQIDPIIRPNANPAARLTVGQQLSRNLYVSYSTNLATEQDQTALAEYTFSNRFSGLATYTQGGSSTRQGLDENVFTIELRGRQRFSLGFLSDLPAAAPSPGGETPDLLAPAKLPTARVEVTPVEDLKLNNRKLRELLPIMGQGFSRSLARLGERRLREYLQEHGFFFAEVRFRCEPIDCSGAPTRVFYDIEPNQVYDLKEIRLEGAKQLRLEEVRGDLRSEVASRVGGIPFFKDLPVIGGYVRGLTSNERLKSDEETIRRLLVDRGYLRARVRTRLAVKPENEDLLLIFDVDEGPLSKVSEVMIRGNATISEPRLRQAIPLRQDDPYSPTRARTGAQQIRQLYAEQGFLETTVNLEIEESVENSLQLVYRVDEGARAVIREIEIAGTTRTGKGWIRRYYDFQLGDVLTPDRIRATQNALYATNAFREVSLRATPLGGDDGSAHKLTIKLTEAKPLLFVYGLGYSTDDGIRGSIELANTNLRGSLDALSLRLRASRREQITQFSFTDLRPFGWKLPTTISTFYNRSANLRTFVRRRVLEENGRTNDSNEGKGFGLQRYGSFIQTERKLDDRTSLRFRYNFERASLFGIDEKEFAGTEVTRNERAIRLGVLSAGVTRDTRDNVLNPMRGQLISADHSLAAVFLGGNESFNKFFATYQRYHTLDPSKPFVGGTTLAFSARLGMAAVFRTADRNNDGTISESERRLPISERFFSGGATTLRGFRFETAGPQEILEPRPEQSCNTAVRPCDLPTLVPVGGDALAILNFEFRYPLSQRLRLVPFYDLGNVFRRVQDFSFGKLTHTVGIGLRINTPIGPVGVDYGFLVDPPAYLSTSGALIRQPRGVFHVRLGQSF